MVRSVAIAALNSKEGLWDPCFVSTTTRHHDDTISNDYYSEIDRIFALRQAPLARTHCQPRVTRYLAVLAVSSQLSPQHSRKSAETVLSASNLLNLKDSESE